MSGISSINSSVNLSYQLQLATKQTAKPATSNAQQPVRSTASEPAHDGDSDGGGGLNKTA
jgi:hypothetical protein